MESNLKLHRTGGGGESPIHKGKEGGTHTLQCMREACKHKWTPAQSWVWFLKNEKNTLLNIKSHRQANNAPAPQALYLPPTPWQMATNSAKRMQSCRYKPSLITVFDLYQARADTSYQSRLAGVHRSRLLNRRCSAVASASARCFSLNCFQRSQRPQAFRHAPGWSAVPSINAVFLSHSPVTAHASQLSWLSAHSPGFFGTSCMVCSMA